MLIEMALFSMMEVSAVPPDTSLGRGQAASASAGSVSDGNGNASAADSLGSLMESKCPEAVRELSALKGSCCDSTVCWLQYPRQ
jgi:hypothetical protein